MDEVTHLEQFGGLEKWTREALESTGEFREEERRLSISGIVEIVLQTFGNILKAESREGSKGAQPFQSVEEIKTKGKRKLDVFLQDAKIRAMGAGAAGPAGAAASGASSATIDYCEDYVKGNCQGGCGKPHVEKKFIPCPHLKKGKCSLGAKCFWKH